MSNRPTVPASLPSTKLKSKPTVMSLRLSTVMPSGSEPVTEPQILGPLCKRNHPIPFWPPSRRAFKQHWFMIDRSDKSLKLYNDSEVTRHPNLKPKKVYDLVGCELLVKDNDNNKNDDCSGKAKSSFVLCLKNGKKMELGCEDSNKRREWLDFIESLDESSSDKENNSRGVSPNNKQSVNQSITMSLDKSINNSSTQPTSCAPPMPPKKPAVQASVTAPPTPSRTPLTQSTKESVSRAIALGAVSVLPMPQQPQQTEPVIMKPALPSSSPTKGPRFQPPAHSPPPKPTQSIAQSTPSVPQTSPAPPQRPPRALPVAPTQPTFDEQANETTLITSPSPMTDSERALSATLTDRHAKLTEHAGQVGSLAWDDTFQTSLRAARSARTATDAVSSAAALQTHVNDFARTSVQWAKRIVDEYSLNVQFKTLKPINEANADDMPRESLRYLVEGIAFEFASAGELDEEANIRANGEGGFDPESESAAKLADVLASKQATAELHAINALASIVTPDSICLPLVCLVDYLGFRIRCVATIPIYDKQSSLVWGESVDGRWSEEPIAATALAQCGAALNLVSYDDLDEHTIPLSNGIKVYAQPAGQGNHHSSSRLYIINLQCLLPVDLDVHYSAMHEEMEPLWATKTFRREFLIHQSVALCSDAYRREVEPISEEDSDDEAEHDADDHEANAAKASKFLQETSIPRFMKELDRSMGGQIIDCCEATELELGDDDEATVNVGACLGAPYTSLIADGPDLCKSMHAHAINLRYLARVAELTKQPHVRTLAMHEMVARQCKALLASNLRTLQRTNASKDVTLSLNGQLMMQHTLYELLKTGVVDFMNYVLGSDSESETFWSVLLYPDMALKYGFDRSTTNPSILSLKEIRASIHKPLLFMMLQQRCGFTFANRVYDFNQMIQVSDFVSFDAHYKSINPILPVHQSIDKARVNCARSPYRISPSDWQTLGKALDIEQALHADVSPMTMHHYRMPLNEARNRLKSINQSIYVALQCGDIAKAASLATRADELQSKLCYESSTLTTFPASGPSPSSVGPHLEHARLCMNLIWLAMLDNAVVDEKERRRRVTDLFNQARSSLDFHLPHIHPLMLSLHYAMAHFTMKFGPSNQSNKNLALLLLERSFGLADHLYSVTRPFTIAVALQFAQQCARVQARDELPKINEWLTVAAQVIEQTTMKEGEKKDRMMRIKQQIYQYQARADVKQAMH